MLRTNLIFLSFIERYVEENTASNITLKTFPPDSDLLRREKKSKIYTSLKKALQNALSPKKMGKTLL